MSGLQSWIFPRSRSLGNQDADEMQDRSDTFPSALTLFCRANCTTSLVERSRFGAIIIPFLRAFPQAAPLSLPLFTLSRSFSLPLSLYPICISHFLFPTFSRSFSLSTAIFRSLFLSRKMIAPMCLHFAFRAKWTKHAKPPLSRFCYLKIKAAPCCKTFRVYATIFSTARLY